MKKLLLVGLALATALATVPAAHAGSTELWFTITGTSTGSAYGTDGTVSTGIGSGSGITGSGDLWGTLIAPNTYAITRDVVDITINGVSASVIPASGLGVPTTINGPNSTAMSYNDLLYLSSNPNDVDDYGLSFQIPGNEIITLWLNGNGDVLTEYNPTTGAFNPVSFNGYDINMADGLVTPEPSSWLLLGTGLFLLAGFVFWKARPGALMANMNRAA